MLSLFSPRSALILSPKEPLSATGVLLSSVSSGGEIKFTKSNHDILMTGPSAHIFSGDIDE